MPRIVSVLVLAVCLASGGYALAQDHSKAIESNETGHVVSPPLGEIPRIPEPSLNHRAIPLRGTHPAGPTQSNPDPVLQTQSGAPASASSALNFLGVGTGIASNYGDCCAPPDTNGAAGATQYVQWVNLSFAVFSKADGSLQYGPTAGNALWQSLGGPCASNNSGDPIAQYDKQAGRWVMMQPVFSSPYYICAAVSATSDATGSWYLYSFAVPGNYFPDYPKLAVWPDGYYLSYNRFQGNFFYGATACALDRQNMLGGNPSNPMQCFNLSTSYGSLLPSDLDGASGAAGTTVAPPAGAPNYFVNFGSNSLNLWKFHVDWTTPGNSTFTGPTNIPVASFSEACGGGACIPQLNTSEKLDSLGDRLMYRLAYRNFGNHEALVVTHSVSVGGAKHRTTYTGVRWYELRQTSGSGFGVYQQGTFAPDSNHRWMGSIAMDKVGDIAVGYSVSGSNMNPAIHYTGRVPSDSLGTMESEATLYAGTGSQLSSLSRWGDYSSMSVDPTDDCTFWYTNEYLVNYGTFNWSTRVSSFKFPGCQ
jgi:hypothetical protein